MGGKAFKHLELVRVKREDVLPTVKYVVDQLAMPDFTYDYAVSHMMGSAGKQDDSGDLDFALNNKLARFVGEPELPRFSLRQFAERCREVLPEGSVSTKTLRGGQFQSAWPVAGDPAKGLVQVDFFAGSPRWLMFTHYSPGLDRSPYKGVMVSTMMGVLAKMHKDFELYADGSFAVGDECQASFLSGKESERVARVGLHYDLEQGLYRKWQMQLRPGNGLSAVDADFFETHVQLSPRFARLQYVTEPEAVLELLFGRPVKESEVATFEDLVGMVAKCFPDRFQEAKERFAEAFLRSGGKGMYTADELDADPVWNAL